MACGNCRRAAFRLPNNVRRAPLPAAQVSSDLGDFGMGVIMIRCPQTGREIPTGIEMDTAEFRRAPVFFSRVQCPVCAREHEWFAKGRMGVRLRGCGIRVGQLY